MGGLGTGWSWQAIFSSCSASCSASPSTAYRDYYREPYRDHRGHHSDMCWDNNACISASL